MPNMINHKNSLVVVKDKLFVFSARGVYCGKGLCEVFDVVCGKFVALKKPQCISLRFYWQYISVGNKIILFKDRSPNETCCNVGTDEWNKESCKTTIGLYDCSCLLLKYFVIRNAQNFFISSKVSQSSK